MLSVTHKPFLLYDTQHKGLICETQHVIKLNVVMLSVVAPLGRPSWNWIRTLDHSLIVPPSLLNLT